MQDVSFVVLNKEKSRIEQMAVSLFRKIKPFADLFLPYGTKGIKSMNISSFLTPDSNCHSWPGIKQWYPRRTEYGICGGGERPGRVIQPDFHGGKYPSPKIRGRAIGFPKGKRAAMTLVLGYPDVKFLRSVQREKLIVKYM